MRCRSIVLVACLVALPIAGCVGSSGQGGPGGNATPADDATSTLDPSDAQAPTTRAHVHDRWNGQDEKVLVDETITTRSRTDVDPSEPGISMALNLLFGPDEVRFRPPKGEIVPPGTDKVVITAEWPEETAPRFTREAFLVYRTAGSSDFQEKDDLRTTPAQWVIDTTVEDADDGHAKMSVWQFRLELRTDSDWTGPFPSTQGGLDVDVKVVAHRVNGSLPLEPPHPDWFANGTERPIHSGDGSAEAAGAWFLQTGTDGSAFPAGDDVDGTEHGIVPPGTQTLVAKINWTDESPTPDAVAATPDLQWNNGRRFEWNDWTATAAEPGHYVYTLPVSADMVDGMYAGTSRWRFRYGFFGRDTGVDEPVFSSDVRAPYHFDGSWTIQISAWNTTEPAVGG